MARREALDGGRACYGERIDSTLGEPETRRRMPSRVAGGATELPLGAAPADAEAVVRRVVRCGETGDSATRSAAVSKSVRGRVVPDSRSGHRHPTRTRRSRRTGQRPAPASLIQRGHHAPSAPRRARAPVGAHRRRRPGCGHAIAAGQPILVHPVPQGAGADPEIPGHLSDRLAGLSNDRHCPVTELGVVRPPL